MSENTDTSLYDRVKRAFQGASDASIAERLQVSRSAVSQWKQGSTKPDAYKLIRVSEVTETPLEWLLTGDEKFLKWAGKLHVISRAIEATDDEIIEKFDLEELRAMRELAAESGYNIPEVIHLLSVEALRSRGLLRNPTELIIVSLKTYEAEAEFVPIHVLGEIQNDNLLYLFSEPVIEQVPKDFRDIRPDLIRKDGTTHPNAFHAYRISTDELTAEGIHRGDIVICSDSPAHVFKDGMAAVLPIEDHTRALIRRVYRDPFNSSRFMFRPIKGKRPIERFYAPWSDMDIILGVVTA